MADPEESEESEAEEETERDPFKIERKQGFFFIFQVFIYLVGKIPKYSSFSIAF